MNIPPFTISRPDVQPRTAPPADPPPPQGGRQGSGLAAEIAAALAADNVFLDRLADRIAARLTGSVVVDATPPAPPTPDRARSTSTDDSGNDAVEAVITAWRSGAEQHGLHPSITPTVRKRAQQVLTDRSLDAAARTVDHVATTLQWAWTNSFFAGRMATSFPSRDDFRRMHAQAVTNARHPRGIAAVPGALAGQQLEFDTVL